MSFLISINNKRRDKISSKDNFEDYKRKARKTIAENIYYARNKNNISIEELSEKTGISTFELRHYEWGLAKLDFEKVCKIAFELKICWLDLVLD
ncbi:helix-turn-helix domain-containing protein [Pseudomonadota bacterium]